ncbi:putative Sulfite exporter TauE/SafE-containing protein 2, partial [Homarus americanus]
QLKQGTGAETGYDTSGNTTGPFSGLSPSRRKFWSLLIPIAFYHFWYWSMMCYKELFYVFEDKYLIAIAMIPGSMIAGMTCVGGGAIAFPVMTLAMDESPIVARDLSITIQANGMLAASFSILFMKVHIERHSLLYSFLGSSAGVIFGLEVIDPILSPSVKKMGFASIFFAFAFTLFLINWNNKRRTYNNIQDLNWWKILLIFVFGFIGGIFTAFAGCGSNIWMFSLLTLFFKISEKVATPTSVILMALNSLVCWGWRSFVTTGMPQESWDYLYVVLPIATMFAPLGAFIGTHFHRLVLAACVYILNTATLVSAFAIVPQTPALTGGSVGLIIGTSVFFAFLFKLGDHIKAKQEENMTQKISGEKKNDVTGSYINDGYINS